MLTRKENKFIITFVVLYLLALLGSLFLSVGGRPDVSQQSVVSSRLEQFSDLGSRVFHILMPFQIPLPYIAWAAAFILSLTYATILILVSRLVKSQAKLD